jgi:thermolysin
MYFIDARTGEVVLEYSDLKTEATVGRGVGVLGDVKKMSTSSLAGSFVTRDALRPPSINTYDMKGDVYRVVDFLNYYLDLDASDLANDSDNDWTDGPAVDAHAHAGWTYDYYHRRFGRRGLDNNNLRMQSLVHPVHRDDVWFHPDWIVGLFYINAFYAGDGVMVYGEGLPPGLFLTTGQEVSYFSAGLDVVAHELSHGVTDFSSQLIYQGESGALNEAFSDIMAVGVEFLYQPPGGGPGQADYLIGEDIITPGGIRSLSDPASFGDPDHYSVRYTGSEDNGGVHINCSIASHAFYLAIEGGQNRVSGLTVGGVGSSSRADIEVCFYRGFALMLPPNADFSTARAATLQAARDLHGAGSNAERALAEAWTAVGVE